MMFMPNNSSSSVPQHFCQSGIRIYNLPLFSNADPLGCDRRQSAKALFTFA